MPNACTILLVEDDQNDAFFVTRALKEIGFDGNLIHFENTSEAKSYLLGEGAYSDRERHPVPQLIVADSAVSIRDSGVELLEWIRQEQTVKSIPFIILSGGVSEETRQRAEAAGVRQIVTKGNNFRDLIPGLRSILLEFPPECREWLK